MATIWKPLRIAVLALGLVALLSCAQAATAGGGGGMVPPQATSPTETITSGEAVPRAISVTGSGVAMAQPDVATVQFGTETVDVDPAEAVAMNNTTMAAVMAALGDFALEETDIQTVAYNLYIEQVVDKDGNVTGERRYHVINELRVTLHDLARVGELLQAVLAAGANSVNIVTFGIEDPAALQREARDLAIADALAKAEQMAEGFGATLGGLRQASEYGGDAYPMPMSMDAGRGGGGSPVPIAAGQLSVSVQVQASFDLADEPAVRP